ncbi:hypothetical protein HMPREF0083_05214, partial [Aneurinibacillus aneurinilyticus ATCC 12856]
HMFVVGGKKRRKGSGRERSEKDMPTFLLPERRAPFSESPPSNHAILSTYPV